MSKKFAKPARRLTAVALALAVAALLVMPPSQANGAALARTSRIFATPPGALRVPISQFARRIAQVDVSPYRQIRIVVAERVGSPTNVRIRLLSDGHTLDVMDLSPQSTLTRVYDVPGMMLDVSVMALGPGTGDNAIDVIIYGNE